MFGSDPKKSRGKCEAARKNREQRRRTFRRLIVEHLESRHLLATVVFETPETLRLDAPDAASGRFNLYTDEVPVNTLDSNDVKFADRSRIPAGGSVRVAIPAAYQNKPLWAEVFSPSSSRPELIYVPLSGGGGGGGGGGGSNVPPPVVHNVQIALGQSVPLSSLYEPPTGVDFVRIQDNDLSATSATYVQDRQIDATRAVFNIVGGDRGFPMYPGTEPGVNQFELFSQMNSGETSAKVLLTVTTVMSGGGGVPDPGTRLKDIRQEIADLRRGLTDLTDQQRSEKLLALRKEQRTLLGLAPAIIGTPPVPPPAPTSSNIRPYLVDANGDPIEGEGISIVLPSGTRGKLADHINARDDDGSVISFEVSLIPAVAGVSTTVFVKGEAFEGSVKSGLKLGDITFVSGSSPVTIRVRPLDDKFEYGNRKDIRIGPIQVKSATIPRVELGESTDSFLGPCPAPACSDIDVGPPNDRFILNIDRSFGRIEKALNATAQLATDPVQRALLQAAAILIPSSPVESALQISVRTAVRAKAFLDGGGLADQAFVLRYYDRFFSGVGTRLSDEGLSREARNTECPEAHPEDCFSRKLMVLQENAISKIDEIIQRHAATGSIDVGAIELELANLNIVVPRHEFKSGKMFLVLHDTDFATLAINNIKISEPTNGQPGSWSGTLVYTLSDDFGFGTDDVTIPLDRAVEKLQQLSTDLLDIGLKFIAIDQAIASGQFGNAVDLALSIAPSVTSLLGSARSVTEDLFATGSIGVARALQLYGGAHYYTIDMPFKREVFGDISTAFVVR